MRIVRLDYPVHKSSLNQSKTLHSFRIQPQTFSTLFPAFSTLFPEDLPDGNQSLQLKPKPEENSPIGYLARYQIYAGRRAEGTFVGLRSSPFQ